MTPSVALELGIPSSQQWSDFFKINLDFFFFFDGYTKKKKKIEKMPEEGREVKDNPMFFSIVIIS